MDRIRLADSDTIHVHHVLQIKDTSTEERERVCKVSTVPVLGGIQKMGHVVVK